MRSWLWLVLITAAAVLAGCPKPPTSDQAAQNSNPAGSTAAPAPAPADPNPPAAAAATTGTGSDKAAPGENQAAPAAPAAPGGTSAGAATLEGQWFVMFGRHDVGIVEHGWNDGHKVAFFADGRAIWTEVASGKEGRILDSRWRTQGNEMVITFSAVEAAKSGISRLAPLGIGRNEEIGLTSAYKPTAAEIEGAKVVTERVKFTLDENYLTINDNLGRIMVYGRCGNSAVKAPNLAGEYSGQFGAKTGLKASASWNGTEFSLPLAGGSFNGQFIDGYVVGQLKYGNLMSLAAFRTTPDGTLKGIYCTDPFNQIKTDLLFSRL